MTVRAEIRPKVAYIEVTLKHPGDFGGIFWSGATRSEEEERREMERVLNDIRRCVVGADARFVYEP